MLGLDRGTNVIVFNIARWHTHDMAKLIDLSHTIADGMETYPGLPTPTVADHLTREAAEEIYGPGYTFQIGLITMCTNTGTYLDVPFHRYADGHDLSELALERVAGVPGVLLDCRGHETIDLTTEQLTGATGKAVLIRTDHSVHFGTADYYLDHPHLSTQAANALVEANVACVAIDTLNIDGTKTGDRPIHSILLGANIPIIEHLTNVVDIGDASFTFTAVPPKIVGAGTFTVRAFADVAS